MKKLTAEERSALAKASWKNRRPAYEPSKTLTLRPDVYNALAAKKGDRTWAEFLCALADLPPPLDRRKSRAD